MKRNKLSLFVALVAALSMTSCYHEFPNGGGGGGGTTTANVSLTLVSDTLPTNGIAIISFRVSIGSIVLTSSTGTTSTLSPGNLIVDLARAQSDSIYLGTITGVPTGTNSSISVQITGGEIAFYNGTGVNLTSPSCAAGDVCIASFNGNGTPVITSSQNITGNTGFGIDFNLANAFTITGTTLGINLTNSGNTNVLSSFTLPRNANLAAGQLDLIEDFTGVATVTGTSVKVVSQPAAGRGTITASSGTNTVYDQDPSQTLCPAGTTTLSGCITTANEAVSMDAILNSDGTFTVQEIEPLLNSPIVDTVEGTVIFINPNNQTQFEIVTSDIIPATTGSKIGSLNMGDPLTVNLGNPIGGGYLVDTKGLQVGGALSDFQGGTDTSVLHLGQTVAVHVNSFTAGTPTTAAIANSVDTVTLRWSRFIATVNNAASPEFSITNLPGYFGFPAANPFDIETYVGTQGADGITNLDLPAQIAGVGGLAASQPVGLRALFLENNTNSEDPPFFAAKVRQQP